MAATWRERLERPGEPKRTRLTSAFAGVPAGHLLYVSTPREIDTQVRLLAPGTQLTVARFRDRLAVERGADAVCPVTTSMFLRICAEVALEELGEGRSPDEVAPFWRAMEPSSAVARRLDDGPERIRDLRARELAARSEQR